MSLTNFVLSWNVRGVGKFEKKVAIRKLVGLKKPSVIFLQETKLRNADVSIVSVLCGRQTSFKDALRPSNGLSRGLITLWEEGFFKSDSMVIRPSFICVCGKLMESKLKCLLINIYAPNDTDKREEIFEEILGVVYASDFPILMGGDFNVVRTTDEKKDGFQYSSYGKIL
ncbi:hypothetical protein HRI_003168800 [Hibiscus trionum]|uniref:Endonuclease/exonuclease/phosphatase domain-containing protein n=1 Tax=Hibiscus trionum TaxID=183268 RepID=A0A9W7IEU1_HIBTR|nr:hypothetical protein HRI_003168800 [Hibiscus trionum]